MSDNQNTVMDIVANLKAAMLKTPPRIIINNHMIEQVRFPKSKKNRIRKKWANRIENFRPSTKIMIVEGSFVCHPSTAYALYMELRRQGYIGKGMRYV